MVRRRELRRAPGGVGYVLTARGRWIVDLGDMEEPVELDDEPGEAGPGIARCSRESGIILVAEADPDLLAERGAA
jgi:hypothetical protein